MSCYYPNGDPSKENDIPCSNDGDSACCPQGWACQSNGLCHNADLDFYARYTCTDQSWKSPNCPRICTYDDTAGGNEAILQCTPGNYCCDTHRPDLLPDNSIDSSLGCCHNETTRFQLSDLPYDGPDPASSSSSPTSSSSSSSPSSSSSSSSPSSSIQPSPTLRTITLSTQSSALSGQAASSGTPQVSIITSILTPAPAASNSPTSTPKHTSNVVGPAVGVPVGVIGLAALIALIFFLLRRRRRNRKPIPQEPTFKDPDNLHPMYEKPPPVDTSGLAGTPFLGKPELEGSPAAEKYTPGLSPPPAYKGETSPASNVDDSPNIGNRGSTVSELTGTPAAGAAGSSPRDGPIAEGKEPSELPGDGLQKEERPQGLRIVNA